MQFRLLGPVEVKVGEHQLVLGGVRTRTLLAMLVVHANEVVSVERLTAELWPEYDSDRAAANLHVRLSELRKALREAGEADRLVTRPPGYVLRVAQDESDISGFSALVREGQGALATGDAVIALRRFNEALALWRGPALADVADAPFARAEAARLEEARLAALEGWVDAGLRCGKHSELIGDLEALTAAHPLRERFWGQRMLALYRAGRQAEALRAYQEVRHILADELGIDPGTELRDLEARILRQESDLDQAADGQSGRVDAPQTHYVESDGVHIAYQVLGAGEPDIVFVPGTISHLDLWWEDPTAARFFRQLASLGRLIMFDKRDTGLSDRVAEDAPLEQRMDDVRAVMGACASDRAVLFGYSEGGPMSILFAATYPDRVRCLILAEAGARMSAAPDYPCGKQTDVVLDAVERTAAQHWGHGDSIEWFAPNRANSARAREGLARWERMAASPGALLRIVRMLRDIDVRSVLPAIRVPTLIIQRRDDRAVPPCHGRYLAEHLPQAEYFEQPGDHLLWLGDTDAMFVEIQQFLTRASQPREPDRVLVTVLCIRTADGNASMAGADDHRGLNFLGAYNERVKRQVESYRGRLIKCINDSIIATFDGPARAIRCAAGLRDSAAEIGIDVQAAVHVGEVDILGEDVTGPPVHIATRIAALARPAEVLASGSVKDLVVGSGISFTDRGACQLPDHRDVCPVFAVTDVGLPA